MLKNGVIHGAAEFEFKEDTEIVLLRKFVCRFDINFTIIVNDYT